MKATRDVTRAIVATLALAFAACDDGSSSGPTVGGGDVRAELMASDRSFADSVSERGLAAWMEHMAPGAVRLVLGQSAIRGTEAIRAADSSLFVEGVRLTWTPVDGGRLGEGEHGFTTGTYVLWLAGDDGVERDAGSGSYITIWEKDEAGRWRVVLDGGAADAAN